MKLLTYCLIILMIIIIVSNNLKAYGNQRILNQVMTKRIHYENQLT